MRAMRWLLGCLAVLLIAALAAAWQVPPLLDGARFQAPLQRLASRALGTPVRIEGPIHLRLLPQPALQAGRLDIEAANPAGASLTAQGVSLRLALAPLLVGRLEARALVLRQPDLRLPDSFGARDLLARRPAWLAGMATRVEDGRIEAGGLALRGVDASVSVDPLSGDLAASGAATASGRRWAFAARLTPPGGDGAAGINLSLSGQGDLRDTALVLSGQLAADGSLQGHVAAHGADLAALLPAPSLPFTAEGRVSLAANLAAADDLAVTLGGAPARGAVALRLAPMPRLDVALAASRLDLDPWLALLRRDGQTAAFLGGIPLGIDLSAEAASLSGGTLRGLRAAFDVTPGRVDMREFRAVLPGEAMLHLTGELEAGARPGLAADASLTAPALRATLAWMAPLLPRLGGLPPDVLRAAALSAHVTAGQGDIALSRIHGTLDGGTVAGSIAWHRGAEMGPDQVAARLSLQRLDLDPWLEAGAGGPDLDLQLDARQARLRGVALAPLRLDLGRRNGVLDLRRLQADAGPVHASASGRLDASGRLEGGALVVDARHLSALPLPVAQALLPPEAPLREAKLHVAIEASGTRAALSARLRASLGDLQAELDPVIDLATGAWNGTAMLRHPDARALLEAIRLLPRFGLPGGAAWLGDGSFSLRASGSLGPDALALDSFDLAAGDLRAGGAWRLQWAGPPSLSGRIVADTLPVPPLGSDLADAVLLAGAPGWRAKLRVQAQRVLENGAALAAPFDADLSLADGTLRVDGMRAGLGGGTLQGEATLDLGAAPPRLSLRTTVRNAAISDLPPGLPVDLASGRASGQAEAEARGHSMAALLSTLHGTATGTVRDGSLRGLALAGLPPDLPRPAVAAALAGGITAFDEADFAAVLDHGVAALTQGRISSPAGPIDVSGSLDLSQDFASLLLAFAPAVSGLGAAPPVIGLRLEGRLGQVQRIPQLADLARWRATRDQQ